MSNRWFLHHHQHRLQGHTAGLSSHLSPHGKSLLCPWLMLPPLLIRGFALCCLGVTCFLDREKNKTKKARALSRTGLFPKCLQQLRLDQAKLKSLELHPSLPHRFRNPNPSSVLFLSALTGAGLLVEQLGSSTSVWDDSIATCSKT